MKLLILAIGAFSNVLAYSPNAFVARPAALKRTASTSRLRAKRSGIRMYWHIFPRDYSDSDFHDNRRSTAGTILTKEYHIEPGQSQTVGKYDLGAYADQSPNVDVAQCVLQVAEDGSCIYAYAQGNSPTGWRTRPDEPWRWMQPGESTELQSGHKVSLDCNHPEDAVYKCEKAGRFLVEDYINSVNGVGSVNLNRGTQQGGQLPPGWITQVDQQSGQQYYYNQQTGHTQWDFPQY